MSANLRIRMTAATAVAASLLIATSPHAAAAAPLTMVSGGVTYATYGTSYSDPLVARGGTAPYAFSVVAGTLPSGLSITSDDFIRGVPVVAPGSYDFTIGVRDSSAPQQSATADFEIQVGKGIPILTPRSFPLSLNPLGLSLTSLSSQLTGSDPETPIPGQLIAFSTHGGFLCAARTNAFGVAQCAVNLTQALNITLNGELDAAFAGNGLWAAAGGQAFLLPQPQPPL